MKTYDALSKEQAELLVAVAGVEIEEELNAQITRALHIGSPQSPISA